MKNSSLSALIVDDEEKNISILRELLIQNCPQIEIKGCANGFYEAIDLIKSLRPQLLFLDIEMPYGNAFDLLEKIMPVHCEIIFITAFDMYALKAFKYNALDYLLKPVDIEELKAAVERAAQRMQHENINTQLSNLISNFKKRSLQKIAVPTVEGLVFIEIANILYLRAKGAYTEVYMKDRPIYTASRNISDFEEMLEEHSFFRVHHSFLININYIKKYSKGRGGFVEMEDDAVIEVSARKRDEFLAKFKL